jgi:hypothetical protein
MPPEPPAIPPPGSLFPGDELERWESEFNSDERTSLVELVNRVLDRGVVITGDVTISVAGVDLVYLGLSAILTSISTAREHLGRPAGPERSGP